VLKSAGRWTAVGAAVGGGLFFVLSVYRSIASGGPAWSHLNPILVMLVIGGTVGALVGPLIGAIVDRRKVQGDETPRGST
jgi:ABC-type branched-subunit amino acid transport system permease subunit